MRASRSSSPLGAARPRDESSAGTRHVSRRLRERHAVSDATRNHPARISPKQDIDAAHADDPHMCVDYVEDIYQHLREAERAKRPDPKYASTTQKDVNAVMRGILVDWLVEVAEEYKLSADTLYLSVGYIDRVLSVQPVARTKLQLLGVTCMLIASKYEEIYAPQVDEFCYITENTYSREDVLLMERTVLDALEFELTQPTIKTFLRRALRAAETDAKVEFLANYLCELSLLEYDMLAFAPSVVAAASVSLALATLDHKNWSATLAHYTALESGDLKECVDALRRCHGAAQKSTLSAVREKYAQVKFKCVSLIKPTTE
jgi:cyclin A